MTRLVARANAECRMVLWGGRPRPRPAPGRFPEVVQNLKSRASAHRAPTGATQGSRPTSLSGSGKTIWHYAEACATIGLPGGR